MQRGPQPHEAWVAEICEAFHCTPAEAERQDKALVEAIFEYRNARMAVELFNHRDKTYAFKVLADNPALPRLLARMQRAQLDQPLDDRADVLAREGMAVAEAHAATDDDED